MTAEVTTIVGQLSINEGIWRSEAPNQVAVREPKSSDVPGAGKGDLFIVTEVQGRTGDLQKLEKRLAEIIRDSYYLARGSVTASLRRAVQTGNDFLYQRNRKATVEDRVAGGAVVLVSCEDDAFVAQIGPTAFFGVMGDHIRRYPARSVWLDVPMGAAEEEDASALGLSKLVEPSLHHVRVAPYDVLVLADSRLASKLSLNELINSVDTDDVQAAVKNLGKVANAKQCSALVLEVVEIEATSTGPFKVAAPPKFNKLLGRQKKQAEQMPALEAVGAEAAEAVGSPNGMSTVFANTSVMQKPLRWWENLTGRAEPTEADLPIFNEPERTPAEPQKAPQKYSPRMTTAEISTHFDETYNSEENTAPDLYKPDPIAQQMNTFHDEPEEDESIGPLQTVLQGLVSGVLMLIVLVGNGFKAVARRLPGVSSEHPRQAGMKAQPQSSNIPWKLLRNVAIAIPILVALVVGITYIQQGRMQEAEYQELITSAQSRIEQAKELKGTEALGLMAEAENALIQAEQIKQNQPAITEMRQQIAAEADRVSNVQRLDVIPQLRQYTDEGTNTSKIVLQGVELYVLDKGNDRVYHHRLNSENEGLLPDDQSVLIAARGQSIDNIQVEELLDMTWMPTGGSRQTSDLVILNSSGLLEYNPNWGITTAVVAAREALKLPVAVDSYFGNFYVLDPQANALLRFLPTVDGYSAQPQNYFTTNQPVDLTNAVDMAIDGAIYILYKDGRIAKFLGGQPADFNLTGLDQPLSNPVSIFTKPDEEVQHIYVADAGNQRIVQLNKDGSFVRQLKPGVGIPVNFANLQEIYVDEIGGRMYILDNNNLYMATLPPISNEEQASSTTE